MVGTSTASSSQPLLDIAPPVRFTALALEIDRHDGPPGPLGTCSTELDVWLDFSLKLVQPRYLEDIFWDHPTEQLWLTTQ